MNRKVKHPYKHWLVVMGAVMGGILPSYKAAWAHSGASLGSTNIEERSANASQGHNWYVTSSNSPRMLTVERSAADRRIIFRECMRSNTDNCIIHGRPTGYTDRELDTRLRSLNTMYALKLASYGSIAVLSTILGYRMFVGPIPSVGSGEGFETYRQLFGSGGAVVGALGGGLLIASAEHLLPHYRQQAQALKNIWQNSQRRVDNLTNLVTELNYALAGIDDNGEFL